MNTFWRILLYGTKNFRRNIWLSVIAIITMTMTLLTISVFALGSTIAQQEYQDLNAKIDYLIFLKDSAGDADINNMLEQIEARPEVSSTEFISKEEALKHFEENTKDMPDLKGIVTDQNNPLYREIVVKFHDPKSITEFNKFAIDERFSSIIVTVSYRQNAADIDNYLETTKFLGIIGIAFAAFFIVIAVMVVLNTIKLTIYSKRDEIEVMRLVGASPGFIQGPFWVEGILYGVLSALASALIMWGIMDQLQRLVNQSLADGRSNFFTDTFGTLLSNDQSQLLYLVNYLFMIQIIVGVLLGVFCSILAVRRYLKEN